MNIFIPDELKPVEDEIKRFIDCMIYKLKRNAYKGAWEEVGLEDALTRLREEADELEESIGQGNILEIMMESADCANFALIAASVALRKPKPLFDPPCFEAGPVSHPPPVGTVLADGFVVYDPMNGIAIDPHNMRSIRSIREDEYVLSP